MDEKFQIILSSLPQKAPRSRLEPYRELIDELRERGRTYQEIAQILTEKCQVATSRSAVNDFVRVRKRRKSKQPTARPQESNNARPAGARRCGSWSSTCCRALTSISAASKGFAETSRR